MGSWRGSEQTIGQNFKMKLLLALCMLGLATSSQDYKKFMKWAGTKAMESCWGEDNMKIHTVNMKKAVAKCQQSDPSEQPTDLSTSWSAWPDIERRRRISWSLSFSS